MKVVERIKQSEDLIRWLDGLIEGLSIPSSDRAVIAASCLDVALEHQKAIVLTASASLFGSATALVRLEFEAYVRGVWLINCASDTEVESFKNDKLERALGKMIGDLEEKEAFDGGVLSEIKQKSWNAMCSFTHTGSFQVVRRIKAAELVSNYSDEEILGTLGFADSMALLATIAILGVTLGEEEDKERLAQQLLERVQLVGAS